MTGDTTALDVVSAAVIEKMERMAYTWRDTAAAVGVTDNTVIRVMDCSPRISWEQLAKFAAWVDMAVVAVPRENPRREEGSAP